MSRPAALNRPEAKHSAKDARRSIGRRDGPRSRCASGFAVLPKTSDADQVRGSSSHYSDDSRFRSRIDMARHGFGRGEYKYFSYPLPDLIADLRTALYPPLADIANRWNARSESMSAIRTCTRNFSSAVIPPARRGRRRCCSSTVAGDYNCLHQDLYGEHVFPLQVAILLAEPGRDFSGGEFVLTEQRPRMQSRASVVPLGQGDAVVFAVHHRPVQGTRGTYRVNLRHGVSEIRAGLRHTLGIIFHDAA